MPAHQIKNVANEKSVISHRQYPKDTFQPEIEKGFPIRVRFLIAFRPMLLEQGRKLACYPVEVLDLKARRYGGQACRGFGPFPYG